MTTLSPLSRMRDKKEKEEDIPSEIHENRQRLGYGRMLCVGVSRPPKGQQNRTPSSSQGATYAASCNLLQCFGLILAGHD